MRKKKAFVSKNYWNNFNLDLIEWIFILWIFIFILVNTFNMKRNKTAQPLLLLLFFLNSGSVTKWLLIFIIHSSEFSEFRIFNMNWYELKFSLNIRLNILWMKCEWKELLAFHFHCFFFHYLYIYFIFYYVAPKFLKIEIKIAQFFYWIKVFI